MVRRYTPDHMQRENSTIGVCDGYSKTENVPRAYDDVTVVLYQRK